MSDVTKMELAVAGVINEVANKQFNAYMLGREESIVLARAAIRAMREPTVEMVRSGDDTGCFDRGGGYDQPQQVRSVWQAMIDAGHCLSLNCESTS